MAYQEFKTSDIRADNVASLPATGSFRGQTAWVDDVDELYAWDGAAWDLIGPGGGGSFAPDDAEYIVAASHASLSAERVATDTTTINVDNGTVGQTKWEVIDDSITNTKLRDSAALSVIGRSANSTGDPADIVGATVGHVLQVSSGPVISFGANTSSGVSGGRYDPDREPASGLDPDRSDNFISGEQLSWTVFNSGPTTTTHAQDIRQYDNALGSSNIVGHYAPGGANSSDFALAGKWSLITGGQFSTVGVVMLGAGSWATPTQLVYLGLLHDISNGVGVAYVQTYSNYTTFSSTQGFAGLGGSFACGQTAFFRIKYVASTKVMTSYVSGSGFPNVWNQIPGTTTLTNHPEFGTFINPNGATAAMAGNIHYIRVFTSGVNGATSDQYTGEVIGS